MRRPLVVLSAILASLLAVSAALAARPRPQAVRLPVRMAPLEYAYEAHEPAAAVRLLARVYRDHSLSGLEGLLSGDFRFHYSSGDAARTAYTDGFSRADEMEFARSLFFGSATSMLPPPESLFVTCGRIEEGVDPEHPDSTCQYRLLVAHDFRFRLVFADRSPKATKNDGYQVFHAVRGDAAVRLAGQPADTSRWYLRRWVEDIEAVTLALGKLEGECTGEEHFAPLATAPALLGLRAIDAPVCPTLKVLCDLPGSEPARLEVFDLQGRRVGARDVTPQSAGRVLVEAGGGARFAPGAYWVRLTQAKRAPVTRMVMVAR